MIDVFQGWQVVMPELIVALFALIAPILALSDTDRAGMRTFTLIGLGGALLMAFGSLFNFYWKIPIPEVDVPVGLAFIVLGGLSLLGGLALLFQKPKDSETARPSQGKQTAGIGFAVLGVLLLYLRFILNVTSIHLGPIEFSLQYINSSFGTLHITYASQLFKTLFLAVAFVAVLGIGRPLRGKSEEDWGEFCSLMLFATLGMMVVASATELITLVLGIELASMCSYILAGFRRDAVGAEAGLKYFTIGAISSGLLLFGVSLVYGIAGTTDIASVAKAAGLARGGAFDAVSIIPIVLLLGGLGFKISSVPFHAWAPDVYSGAPAPVAGLLAAGSKAMGFVAVFNVFVVGLVGVKSDWQMAVAAIAAASILFGNLVALQQTSIRRMLAYSSIAQAGYILIAVAVGSSAQDGGTYAVGGGIFHLLTNAAMKLGAFLIVGALLWAGLPDTMDGWKGLGKRSPLFAFCMTLFLLSMAGLPPLGGFASKFVLFSGAIDAGVNSGLGWLVWLAVIAVVGSAISLYYYLRLIRAMVVEEGEPGRLDAPSGVTAAVLICALAVVLMGVWPQPFMDASFKAAQSMLGLG